MMVNLLVVEDNDDHIKDWETIVERHKAVSIAKNDGSIHFHIEIAKNKDEALRKLHTYNFSIAIIDVRLKRKGDVEDYNNTDGIDVLNEIMSTVSCYTVIYTGQSKDAEAAIESDHKEYIKIVDRDTSKSNLIKSLVEENKEIILSINDLKYKFSKSMSSLFYSSIWPRWNYWEESEGKKEALSRHMASHLHASFLNETLAVHPEEYYFIPPISEELDTGYITLKDNKHYILITPRCEIAQKKNNTFQFIELKDISSDLAKIDNKGTELNKELNSLIAKKEDESPDKQEKIKDKEKNIANNMNKKRSLLSHGGNKASLHFIPEIRQSNESSFGPFHAQFDHMVTINKSDLKSLESFKSGVYACLSNEFVPTLIERLGNYFSRIGSPDYSHPE